MNSLTLHALNGSNPLAFLSAVGSLAMLRSRFPQDTLRLHWQFDGFWRPVLSGLPDLSPEQLCESLTHAAPPPSEYFQILGKNITVSPATFREFTTQIFSGANPSTRRIADFAVCFGSEACPDNDKDRIQYTKICFITGSGNQDFLHTAKKLHEAIQPAHYFEALFGPWQYANKGNSFRWDPADAREYALRWNDPGPEGAWTVWGANRLAFEALTLLPSHPSANDLESTGFARIGRYTEFTWPIWTAPASLDVIRSLLSLPELRKPEPNRSQLTPMGIPQLFRARRVRIGAGANFKTSFRPARAV